MPVKDRIEELEMQNAFLQNQLEGIEENLSVLNKENYLIREELKALRGILSRLQDPDYIQEILHNGSNR